MPEPFATEINQQKSSQTNVTGINANKKNTFKDAIEAGSQSQNNANNNSQKFESNVHPPRKKHSKILNLSKFPIKNAHVSLFSKRPKFWLTLKGSNVNLKSD